MIDFKCSKCGEDMESPEGLAGETLKCPKCGSVCSVPPQAVIASPASAPETCLDCGYRIKSGAIRCSNCGSPVPLMTYEDHPLAHQVLVEWLAIDPTTKLRCFGCEQKLSLAGLPTSTMKCPFCGFIPSPGVCQALLRVLEGRRQRELASHQRLRAVKWIAERAAAMDGPKRVGECSRCGDAARSLRETEDKQWVCLPCYRQLYTALATERQIYNLRRAGITVPDDLTAREGRRLWVLRAVRKLGLSMSDDTQLGKLYPKYAEDMLNHLLGGVAHTGPRHPAPAGGHPDYLKLAAELEKSGAEFDQAEAELKQAEAELKMADTNLTELTRRKPGRKSELERLAFELEKSGAEVDQAEAELKKAKAEVKMVERARHFTEVGRVAKLAYEEIKRGSEYPPPVRHFYTKVAGVTYKNDDGSDRQEILATCSPLQTLRVEHEDNNPHDPNATRVCTEDGRMIGHLPSAVASEVSGRMQNGFTYAAISANITGGTKNKPHLGMTILFLVVRPGVSQEEMQAYLIRIMPAVAVDVYDYNPDDYDTDDDDEQDD